MQGCQTSKKRSADVIKASINAKRFALNSKRRVVLNAEVCFVFSKRRVVLEAVVAMCRSDSKRRVALDAEAVN
jgi:hypothetical protein